ncbi:uncharacterized protein TNIN_17781 [Trichonephila inaurata madagascariensis]|uniref:IRF tryptophan pentad repeat domain-containing protein n=1 Tax=Trichonephila inaurata madagascariensis TaxID=2747483 RepID=A0A8X6J8I8_9ARAC|nr:uncharacterized protein TNIN_17781 [Trichonephila inaurata madagascariensis]
MVLKKSEFLTSVTLKLIKKKMGRKGPRLIRFLEEGLRFQKYRNLSYEDISQSIFSIYFPHKTKLLSPADEQIFKNWYALNGKKYTSKKDYTDARQAMSSSLRKSDYVEKVLVSGNKLAYRILNEEEVKEKKKEKDILKKLKKEESDYVSDLSSVDSPKSSGEDSAYSSGVGSPGSSGVGSPGSSGVGSPGSSGVSSPVSSRVDSTIDSLDIETKSLLKGNLLSDPFVPMSYSDPIDFVEEHMDVDNTVDVNLNEPQNPIIRNGSVTLGTVDYTRTVDNIPTEEMLSDHNLQNREDIPNENFTMENLSSNDGSIPSFDDDGSIPSFDNIPLPDFNFEELFGSDCDKLELLPQLSMELPPQLSMELPLS